MQDTSELHTCCSGIISCSWELRSCISETQPASRLSTYQNSPRQNLATETASGSFLSQDPTQQIQARNRRGRQLSYEIGSALHLQPSHTTERGGVMPLETRATNKISASANPMRRRGLVDGWIHSPYGIAASRPRRGPGRTPWPEHAATAATQDTNKNGSHQTLGLHRINQNPSG